MSCSRTVCSLCMCVCSLHVISTQVMVSLCLAGVNPHHLAMIGSSLSHWNPKWLNHISYGKQSIFGSDIHSISKPQIAPIKALVWHAHTNTQLFDLIWLVSIAGHRVFSFPNRPQSAPICTQSPGFTAWCVCVNTWMCLYAHDRRACVHTVSVFRQ